MRPDYRLTEKEARLDLLTQDEISDLKQKMLDRKNDYIVFQRQGRDLDLTFRENAILKNLALQAGWTGDALDNIKGQLDNREQSAALPSDEDMRAKVAELRRLLSESPEYSAILSEREQARQADRQFDIDNEQQMYIEALLLAVPRIDGDLQTDRKEIRLTPNDVHSVLLTSEERQALERDYKAALKNLFDKVFSPLYQQVQKQRDLLLDKLAIQAGFAQFDENEQGTGLRNYTAQKKPMNTKVKQQLDMFHRIYDESKKNGEAKECNRLSKNLSDWDSHMKNQFGQVLLRNMLALTNERIARTDAAGRPILTPEKYLEVTKNMDAEKKRHFDEPLTTWIETKWGDKAHIFPVDKSIANFVKQINDIGYLTGQSCSGLLGDHPNYRYVQDSPRGLYVEGECVNYNKQGCGTYLTFYKSYNNIEVNKPEQIDNIRRIAADEGWIVEDMDIFGFPSIRLGLPATYDGMGTRELLHEVNASVDRDFPGLYKADFMAWLELRNSREPEFRERHGGVVRWTDDMVLARWQSLTRALLVAERQRQDMQRISDVRTYLGGDGHWRIKCRIDGVDQLSEHFSDAAMTALNRGEDIKKLAADIYRSALDASLQQDRGIKR